MPGGSPRAHPAFVTTGAMGTLGPLHQPAGGSVAAVVLTVLGAGGNGEGPRGLHAGPAPGSRADPGAPHPPRPALAWAGAFPRAGLCCSLPQVPYGSLQVSEDRWVCRVCRVRNGRPILQDRDPRHPDVVKRPRVAAGAGPCTWGWPQSHCSPRSTKPFPHTGPPTRRSRSGAFARQVI